MKKKKIAFCLRDMRIGGVEAVCIRLMDALLATGKYEIIFISYVNITTPVYAQWFAAHPDVKTYALYPARGMGTNLPHFFLWRIIRHLMRDVYRAVRRMTMNTRQFADVDLFIDFYNFSFARELKKFRAPKISWWHLSIDRFLERDRRRELDEYDATVALTDGFVAAVRDVYPKYANKITRIYNPIDVDAVRARAELAPCGGDYFACVGRLDGDKDTATVIRAFDGFWNNAGRPDVDLVIVGDGHLARGLRDMAGALPSHEHIVFTGALDNPMGVIGGARANILSSFGEGLPTVLVEGLALNTPEIASDCPTGPREILMDGKIGLLYTPGDADALAAHMYAVWSGNWTPPSAKDTADALRRFDMRTISDAVVRLIESHIGE